LENKAAHHFPSNQNPMEASLPSASPERYIANITIDREARKMMMEHSYHTDKYQAIRKIEKSFWEKNTRYGL